MRSCAKITQATSIRLQRIIDKSVDNKVVFGLTCCIKTDAIDWCGVSGNFQKDDQFFIASVTKLFITAILLRLREEKRIRLNDEISKYLPETIWRSLHHYKGVDYSKELTVQQLMAHTSGLPDYFQQKKVNRQSLEHQLLSGEDVGWSVAGAISESKSMSPLFKPGQKRKAHYSDTNYQLLGLIIEALYGNKLEAIIDQLLVKPLGLSRTYLYRDHHDHRPKDFWYKGQRLHIPKAMSSFGADGGMVSTSVELLTFTEAFFTGRLFHIEYLKELQQWNKIFFPLQSGIGIQRFKLPRIFSPFKAVPELFGHSGLSGTFAFYCPLQDLHIAGTTNQISHPGQSFRLIIRLLNLVGALDKT